MFNVHRLQKTRLDSSASENIEIANYQYDFSVYDSLFFYFFLFI